MELNNEQNPLSSKNKPAVGSVEWQQLKKESHREVERKRRIAINQGIEDLSRIVPGCEKNKGSILQRAVQYIQQLKDNESSNIEKWTLEKLLTEQIIADLETQVKRLREENDEIRKALQDTYANKKRKGQE